MATLCNKLNYKKVALEDLFKDSANIYDLKDEKINDVVFKALEGVEKHYRGIIVSGYPFNLEQSIFI